jgi:hypothetical protein
MINQQMFITMVTGRRWSLGLRSCRNRHDERIRQPKAGLTFGKGLLDLDYYGV